MAIEVVTDFIAKDTVWVRAYVKDSDGDLADPTTSIKITITDPDDTDQVSSQDMTKDSTGVYDYYYNTTTSSTTGEWGIEVITIDGEGAGAKTSTGRSAFELEA